LKTPKHLKKIDLKFFSHTILPMMDIIYFTIPKIKTYINKKGVEKKKLVDMPKEWTTKITSENYMNYVKSNHKIKCIPTGSINNITVIDFDNQDTYSKVLGLYPNLKNYRTIKTKRGYHVYCKYDTNILTRSNACKSLEGIDIANDGHMVIGHGSMYTTLDYDVVNYEDLGGEILEIPTIILYDLKQNDIKEVDVSIPIATVVNSNSISPEVTLIETSNSYFNEISYYVDKNCYKLYVLSGEHLKWIGLGGMLLSVFSKEDSFNLWEKATLLDGSEDKKMEYKTHFKNLKQIEVDKTKAYHTLVKWATKANPNIKNEYKELIRQKIKNEPNYADNDNDCANIILTQISGKIIFAKNQLFIKQNNVWLNGNEKVKNYLINYVMNQRIFKLVGEIKVKKWADYHPAMNVVNTIICKIKNNPCDDVYMKFHTTTKNRICFLDGVLDCVQKKFYTWNEIDFEYYSVVQIQRNFKPCLETPNTILKETIMKNILNPLFGDKTNLFLQLFSRAITGNYEDKNWLSFVGNRNCGKGVLYALSKGAFGDYVSTFGIDNILCGRESMKPITPKDMYWLLDLEFVRFAMPQEAPAEGFKLNSKMMKSINSGGDVQKARRNYDTHDTEFILECLIALFANYKLESTDKDADEKRVEFESVIQFKTNDEIDDLKTRLPIDVVNKTYFEKDETIKDKVNTDEYKDAFILLVLEHYTDKAVSIIKPKDDDDNRNLLEEIYDVLEITLNYNDIVLGSDLNHLFKFPITKVKIELTALGVQFKRNKSRIDTDKRDKMCFYGIKLKE